MTRTRRSLRWLRKTDIASGAESVSEAEEVDDGGR
jgi:hypothetical protein